MNTEDKIKDLTSNYTKPMLGEVYCKAHWYTGDVTIERILNETKDYYIFDDSLNGSYFNKKNDCELI